MPLRRLLWAAAFPIGMFNVDDPAALRPLRAAGFDTVLADGPLDAMESVAREARARGMGLVVHDRSLPSPTAARDWPLAAWYLEDEPEINGISPEALAARSAALRAADPRPQTFVVGSGAGARGYGGTGDVLMVDWYPVPHLPLQSAAEQLIEARKHWPEGKPLWMVLQAFDWREEPQRRPDLPRIGRFPTHRELRFMAYSSILAGADGLFFFRFRDRTGASLLDRPERWQAVSRVTRELALLRPVLSSPRSPLPFPPDPDGPSAASWRRAGRTTLILANPRGDALLKAPALVEESRWRALFEPRRDPRRALVRSQGAWYLRPYQVLVLESRQGS